MDLFIKSEFEDSTSRIDELLRSGIFLPRNAQSPFVRSSFIEILICLRDLMHKVEKYATRISFDNDIVKIKYQTKNNKEIEIKDVTDVIKYVRDALCHLNSDNHYVEKGNIRTSYDIVYGKGKLMKIGGVEQVSDYDDDVCFFYGTQKIFLKRHILRAFREAKGRLLPLFKKQ